jgi:hypothetical protein
MNKLLTLGLSLPLLACVVGGDATTGDDGSGGSGSNGSNGSNGSGTPDTALHISSDMTLTPTYDVAKQTVVDAGATVTIPAGATVTFAPNTSIEVRGTVVVQGSKASPVHLSPATAGGHHYGFTVSAGGTLTMSYGIQTGGGITANGGTVTVTDTLMSQASGDFLVVGAGKVDVSFSAIGLEPGAGTDTTHCDLHFGGTGTTISITHSNISTSSYGLMLYGGTGVVLTNNNWFSNSIQVDTSPGVSGDLSGSWFDKTAPKAGPGATLTYNNPSATRLPAATVDPLLGAGPR